MVCEFRRETPSRLALKPPTGSQSPRLHGNPPRQFWLTAWSLRTPATSQKPRRASTTECGKRWTVAPRQAAKVSAAVALKEAQRQATLGAAPAGEAATNARNDTDIDLELTSEENVVLDAFVSNGGGGGHQGDAGAANEPADLRKSGCAISW